MMMMMMLICCHHLGKTKIRNLSMRVRIKEVRVADKASALNFGVVLETQSVNRI
jgi:hypothetical protein